jgi:hypothetical protein
MTIRSIIDWKVPKGANLTNKTKNEGGSALLCLVHAFNGFPLIGYASVPLGSPQPKPTLYIRNEDCFVVAVYPYVYQKNKKGYVFQSMYRNFDNVSMSEFPNIGPFFWEWYRREIVGRNLKLTVYK